MSAVERLMLTEPEYNGVNKRLDLQLHPDALVFYAAGFSAQAHGVHLGVHIGGWDMPAIKVGVREFREQITRFLESETPVAVTRRGETLGVYVPTPRKTRQVETSELRVAADRLAAVLSDRDEEEIVAEFKQARRKGKAAVR